MEPSGQPFPWHAQVAKFIQENGTPDLSSSKLIVVSDSREKDDFVIESILCTNEENFLEWAKRSMQIREHHALDDHGLHYKDLRYGSTFWKAVGPSLHSACLMDGVAVVMRTEKKFIDENISIVKDLMSRGISSTHHDWKAKQFTEMVGLTSLVGTIVGALSSPGQEVHWVSDHEPPFGKDDQLQDILYFIGRATGMSTPHALGRASVSTPLVEVDHRLWLRDFVAVVDLFAGGVGDSLKDTSMNEATGYGHWEPVEDERRSMKSGTISNWFWLDNYIPLKRLSIDVQLTANGEQGRSLSATWVRPVLDQS